MLFRKIGGNYCSIDCLDLSLLQSVNIHIRNVGNVLPLLFHFPCKSASRNGRLVRFLYQIYVLYQSIFQVFDAVFANHCVITTNFVPRQFVQPRNNFTINKSSNYIFEGWGTKSNGKPLFLVSKKELINVWFLGWCEDNFSLPHCGIRIDLRCPCLHEGESLSPSITGRPKEHQSNAQKCNQDRKERRWIWASIAHFVQDSGTNPCTYHNSGSDHYLRRLSNSNGLCSSHVPIWAFVSSKLLLCRQISK